MTVGGRLQYCGLMTLGTPLWTGWALKLAGRMLANPVRYFRKVDRSREVYPDPLPDMKHVYVENEGVRLHAATHGLGSGKPLMLFLHGFPETWLTWRHQLKEFAGQYELVALDMRGVGSSDAPKGVRQYTPDKLCADAAAVIRGVGHEKAIVVGQDFGGGVAWLLGCYCPEVVEKLVILTSPHPAAYQDPQRYTREQMGRQWYMMLFQSPCLGSAYLRHNDFQELERWLTQPPDGAVTHGAITSQDVKPYKAALSRPGALHAALNYYRAMVAISTKWWTEEVERVNYTPIKAPTLLMYADSDSVFMPHMYQRTEELVPGLCTVCLDRCSHWANQDRPDLVNANITAFLAGKLTTGGKSQQHASIINVKARSDSGASTPTRGLIQVPKDD